MVMEDDGEPMELTLRLHRTEQAVDACYGAARVFSWTALGTLPFMIAYHIDLEPELHVEVDLGSALWLGLLAGALMAVLSGLRLDRRRRALATLLATTTYPPTA
jgi:hypothetical protein